MSESRQLTTTIREIASSILAFSKPQCLVAIVGLSGMLLSGVAQANTPFTTPASYTVGNDGSANVVIPIQVPPGTNGMQPSLNLNYNSNRGNGLMGLGWSIGGVSSITRCGSSVATEGTRRSLQLDSGDKFCLDGQKLKVVNGQTYGSTDAEYRTELANFAKITNTTSNVNNGPDSFEVKTKNGKTITYGSTADATIKVPNKQIIRSWLVKKISDRLGNFMTFSYTNDNAKGEFYLTKIDYTDHSTHAPFAKVEFKYNGNRTDKITAYFKGDTYQTTQRLTNIQTFNEGSIVKDYRLTYQNTEISKQSQLTSLKECDATGNNGNCLEPISFTWSSSFGGQWHGYGNSYTQDGVSLSALLNKHGGEIFKSDFNGDGITDFLLKHGANEARNELLLSSQKIVSGSKQQEWTLFNQPIKTASGTDVSATLINDPSTKVYTGDFNGDGLTDIFAVRVVISGAPSGDNGDSAVILSDGDGSWTIYNNPMLANGVHVVTDIDSDLILGDFDGDSRTDVMVASTRYQSTTPIFLARDNGTWELKNNVINSDGVNVTSYLNSREVQRVGRDERHWQAQTGEFNGDGITDFILKPDGYLPSGSSNEEYSIKTILSNGTGHWRVVTSTLKWEHNGSTRLSEHQDFSQPTVSSAALYADLRSADFNGDGLVDFLALKDIASWHTALPLILIAKGDGTWRVLNSINDLIDQDQSDAFTYSVFEALGNQDNVTLGDFNGDGRTDIFAKTDSTANSAVLISKGGDDWHFYIQPVQAADGGNLSSAFINFGNAKHHAVSFEGNGLTDILVTEPAFNTSTIIIAPKSAPTRLIEEANFGLDRIVDFNYRPLTDTRNYLRGSIPAYPLRAIQNGRHVVGRILASNGNGGTVNNSYTYAAYRVDLSGRTLGFYSMNKYQEESGLLTQLLFNHSFPYIGLLNKKEVKVATNNESNPFESLEETTNTYDQYVINLGGTEIYFPYLDQSVNKKKVLTVDENRNVVKSQRTYKTVTTSRLYDDYGNSTQVKTTYDDGYVETVDNTYTNDESNWLLGQLDQSKVTRTSPTTVATISIPQTAPSDTTVVIDIERISLGVISGNSVTTNQSTQTYQVGETVNLVASVNSPDDSVAKVEFFVDGNSIGEGTSSAAVASNYFNMLASNEMTGSIMTDTGSYLVAAATQTGTNTDYSISWTVTAGNHIVTAVAFDANKNPIAVQASTINTDQSDAGGGSGDTTPPNTAPNLEVLNLGPTVEYAGDKIDFMAVGRDADGVDTLSNVEFKLDGQVMSSVAYHAISSDDNHRKYYWSWPAADSTEGQHTVTVSINDGHTTVTTSKTFTLNPADTSTTGDIVLLSQGKPTEQSSDWPNLTVHSALAVDGNYENRFRWDATNSITHTLNETNAWWQVDLGQVSSIDRVKVWNRADHSDPLSNVYIFVSPTDMRGRSYADIVADSTIKQYHHETQMGVAPDYTHEVSMDGFAGRYVRIQLAGANQLTLAEVEVYGSTGGSSSGGGTPSNTPPTVSVAASNTSPAVDDVVTLTATAADSDGSITKVEFLVDNVLVKTVLAAPYSYNWTATEGSHEIKAKATDSSNAVTTSSIVNVDVTAASNNNNNGTVELLSQGKPATQSTTLDLASSGVPTGADLAVDGNTNGNFQWNSSNSVSHTASDTENETWWQVDLGQSSSVERVKVWNRTDCCSDRLQYFYIFVSDNDMTGKTVQQLLSDSSVKAEPIDESLYNVVTKEVTFTNAQGRFVKIQLAGAGKLNIAEVEVFGIAGGSSGSGDTGSGGGDTTPPANQAPSVSIETPADGSSSVDGNPITITAVAGDNDGTVDSVAFYNNGTQPLGSVTTAPYSITWNNAPVGTHSITAVATDDAGATTTSSAHTISVTVETNNNSGSGTTLYSEDFSGSTHSLTVWGGVQVTGLGTSTGTVLLENFNQASQNWPGYRSLQTFDYEVGQVFRAEATTGSLSGLKGIVFIEGQKLDGTNVQLRANFNGQEGFSYHFVENSTWNYGGGTGAAIKANTTYIVEIEMKANGPALYVYEQGASRASSVVTYEVVNGAWSNYQLRGEGYQGPSVGGTTQLSVDNLTVSRP